MMFLHSVGPVVSVRTRPPYAGGRGEGNPPFALDSWVSLLGPAVPSTGWRCEGGMSGRRSRRGGGARGGGGGGGQGGSGGPRATRRGRSCRCGRRSSRRRRDRRLPQVRPGRRGGPP